MSLLSPKPLMPWAGGYVPAENLPANVVQSPKLGRFMEGIPIPVDYAQWAFLLYLTRTEGGRRLAETIIKAHYACLEEVMSKLAQATSGNFVSAWGGVHLIALILEHNYMAGIGTADTIIGGLNWLSGAAAAADLIGNFTVPATVVYAASRGESGVDLLKAFAGQYPGRTKKGK